MLRPYRIGKELHKRARGYYIKHFEQTEGNRQLRVLSDFIFLHRDNAVVRTLFQWDNLTAVTDVSRESDHAALIEMVARYEGADAARLAALWLARETYQALSLIQSLIFVNIVRHYLTTPGLAFTFIPCAEPELWAAGFAYGDLARLTDADFEIGGRTYGVYGRDWRASPPMTWLALMAERETGSASFVALFASTQSNGRSLACCYHTWLALKVTRVAVAPGELANDSFCGIFAIISKSTPELPWNAKSGFFSRSALARSCPRWTAALSTSFCP